MSLVYCVVFFQNLLARYYMRVEEQEVNDAHIDSGKFIVYIPCAVVIEESYANLKS